MDLAGVLSALPARLARAPGHRLIQLCAAGFLIGTAAQLWVFLAHGPRPYHAAPPLIEAFWSSLLVLYPVTAALLLGRCKTDGLRLGRALMVANVATTLHAALILARPGLTGPLMGQIAFLSLILWTARRARV